MGIRMFMGLLRAVVDSGRMMPPTVLLSSASETMHRLRGTGVWMAGLADIDLDKIPEEMLEKMGITREGFREVRRTMMERDARTPPSGGLAPDFEIERLSPEGKRTDETFRLSTSLAERGRPVALVFGSYT